MEMEVEMNIEMEMKMCFNYCLDLPKKNENSSA